MLLTTARSTVTQIAPSAPPHASGPTLVLHIVLAIPSAPTIPARTARAARLVWPLRHHGTRHSRGASAATCGICTTTAARQHTRQHSTAESPAQSPISWAEQRQRLRAERSGRAESRFIPNHRHAICRQACGKEQVECGRLPTSSTPSQSDPSSDDAGSLFQREANGQLHKKKTSLICYYSVRCASTRYVLSCGFAQVQHTFDLLVKFTYFYVIIL